MLALRHITCGEFIDQPKNWNTSYARKRGVSVKFATYDCNSLLKDHFAGASSRRTQQAHTLVFYHGNISRLLNSVMRWNLSISSFKSEILPLNLSVKVISNTTKDKQSKEP
jgi:hypothetical protein